MANLELSKIRSNHTNFVSDPELKLWWPISPKPWVQLTLKF